MVGYLEVDFKFKLQGFTYSVPKTIVDAFTSGFVESFPLLDFTYGQWIKLYLIVDFLEDFVLDDRALVVPKELVSRLTDEFHGSFAVEHVPYEDFRWCVISVASNYASYTVEHDTEFLVAGVQSY